MESTQGEQTPDEQPRPRKMTPAEAGRKGGTATRNRYGQEFFRKIGSVGGSRKTGPRRAKEAPSEPDENR